MNAIHMPGRHSQNPDKQIQTTVTYTYNKNAGTFSSGIFYFLEKKNRIMPQQAPPLQERQPLQLLQQPLRLLLRPLQPSFQIPFWLSPR